MAERYNLKLAFGVRGKNVLPVCACIMCSRSTACRPKRHDIEVIPGSCYWNKHIFRVRGKGSRRERKRQRHRKLCCDWFFARYRHYSCDSVTHKMQQIGHSRGQRSPVCRGRKKSEKAVLSMSNRHGVISMKILIFSVSLHLKGEVFPT
jgi:hypothetical protein